MLENAHTVQPLEEPRDILVLVHGSQGLIVMFILSETASRGAPGTPTGDGEEGTKLEAADEEEGEAGTQEGDLQGVSSGFRPRQEQWCQGFQNL